MPNQKAGGPVGAKNGTQSGLIDYCTYQIATGAWKPGSRVPSVREAELQWGINRLTVLRAYRRLADLGLLRAVDRSGYFVSETDEVDQVSAHRDALIGLYDDVERLIRKRTRFATLGVLRYMVHLAQNRMNEVPEVAFLECTAYQAHCHAQEILQRLQIPVVPMTLQDVAARPASLPPCVRVIFTTAWHLDQARALSLPKSAKLISVSVEIDKELAQSLPRDVQQVTILDTSKSEIAHFRPGVKQRLKPIRVKTRLVQDVLAALPKLLHPENDNNIFLLAPRYWGVIDERLRRDSHVRPLIFRIAGPGWRTISEAIGLPLGAVD